MFNRHRHDVIAGVLAEFDSDALAAAHCYFGGGTAMVLRFGEWRVSDDIDFLISDWDGYRDLRSRVVDDGIQVLGRGLVGGRAVLADRYGIRTMLRSDSGPIKLEIVHEGRISFDVPGPDEDRVGAITTLTLADMVASKLLANDDRWADRGVFARDVIDLAMLPHSPADWSRGQVKAIEAYGSSIERSLHRAVGALLDDPDWLARCMDALEISVEAEDLRARLAELTRL